MHKVDAAVERTGHEASRRDRTPTRRPCVGRRPVAALVALGTSVLMGLTGGMLAGTAGAVVRPAATGHVVTTTSGSYVALPPARITDTRAGSGFPNAGSTLGAGETLNVQVEGAGGVPTSGVSAVVLNVAATNVTSSSYVTLYPEGGTLPTVANLNTTPGNTVSNLVTVGVSSAGGVTVYNNS